MEKLPSEIVLQIISFLNPKELVSIQVLSHRFLSLTRDLNLWKTKCFEASHQERRRRRQMQFEANDSRYGPLLQAMRSLTGPQAPIPTPNIYPPGVIPPKTIPPKTIPAETSAAKERLRALANWDPGYPDERINYYEEYIHRHAPISISWFMSIRDGIGEEKELREATGVGLLYGQDGAVAEKVVAALDDGSVGIWDLGKSDSHGKISKRTASCFLTGLDTREDRELSLSQTRALMTETGAVECVSIDSESKKGYFGVLNGIVEVDLNTMQVISRGKYPSPITALSEAIGSTPITVGTNLTLHLYDSRRATYMTTDTAVRCELIGGRPQPSLQSLLTGSNHSSSHARLSQPGPLSILHLPSDRGWDSNGSIWVAGRFTSLLNYDRRFFPRIRGTLHSGARISCLRALPFSFTPREFDLMRKTSLSTSATQAAKSIPGHTLLAAGEYRGKGSLELYGLSPDPQYTFLSTESSRSRLQYTSYQNRQTASSSKLLSVAAHGGKLVFSDGDGSVKWMERDGFSPIRTWNINPTLSAPYSSIHVLNSHLSHEDSPPDDIVQLLLPTVPKSTQVSYGGVGEDNLVVWTGDGRIGLLGFGKEKWECGDLEEEALEHEERSRRKEEKDYASRMGRALRHQANELKFVRGLGLK